MAQPVRDDARRLSGIEALRGVAAAAVVFSHAARHVDRAHPAPGLLTLFQPGHAGVDLFFTLSGFIILLVHRQDMGTPARLLRYARRRFDRVMPLYWLALGLTVLLSVAAGHPTPAPDMLAWWATLLPTSSEPLFGVAWTLQYEAAFYVCFALLVAAPRLGVAVFGTWMLLVIALLVMAGLGQRPIVLLCQPFALEFLFGMTAAHLLQTRRIPRPATLAAVAAGMFTSAYAAEASGMLNGYGPLARFAYGLPAALLILGLAAAERAAPLRVPRWLTALGGASYSVYLFQFVFIGAAWQIIVHTGLADLLPPAILFVALATAALLGGLVASRLIERPLLNAMQRHVWPTLAPS